MEIIKKPHDMQKISLVLIKQNKTIGFIPTMGALHEGHLSLIRASLSENDKGVVSIFVNPTQFSPTEDFNQYPHPVEVDIRKLKQLNVDYLFLPEKGDIYPPGYSTYVEVENLTKKLCGLSRPNHFRGVTTVCTKLFQITLPTIIYFGQKDYQQALIIQQLVKDLNFSLRVKVLSTVREKDGLALSSRNKYLSTDERKEALQLYQALKKAETMIQKGERESEAIKQAITNRLKESYIVQIDYISICNSKTLGELNYIDQQEVLIALAAFINKIRLIDNVLIQVPKKQLKLH